MQRMPTGIPGLDELMEGGLPLGRIIPVLGNSGSGRSILGLQCLHTGAKKFSEPGLYVTLGAPAAQVRQEALRFGWNLRKLEEQNMLQFLDGSKTKQGLPGEEDFSLQPLGFDLDRLLLEIMRTAKRIGAKRLVFDSLPTLGFNYERPLEVNQALFKVDSGDTELIRSGNPVNIRLQIVGLLFLRSFLRSRLGLRHIAVVPMKQESKRPLDLYFHHVGLIVMHDPLRFVRVAHV